MSNQIATFTRILVMSLLLSVLTSAFNVQQVKAEPTTWIVDDDGPADFHVIQEAIDAANTGDTVYVSSGTYYENVVVNKTISLIGENKNTTVIDGNKTDHGIWVAASVNITGFTIRNCFYDCIHVREHVDGNNIIGNILVGNNDISSTGIWLEGSHKNTLNDNIIQGFWMVGIEIRGRSNTVSDNTVSYTNQGIDLCGGSNNLVENNLVYNNNYGIITYISDDNTIRGNTVVNNTCAIEVDWYSDANSISHNNVINNSIGLITTNSNNNNFFHNNFINNVQQVYDRAFDFSPSFNTWDDGYPYGGNYWSDYNGTDLFSGTYQNETGSDGIGDTPYIINAPWNVYYNKDNYPLMNPIDTISPNIMILSPENKIYAENVVPLTFIFNRETYWIGYSLDRQMNITISGNTTLIGLSDGKHTIKVYANDTAGNTSFSDIVYFSIDTNLPSIWIVSPENKTYDTTDIPLTFTLDESVSWTAYSLDNQANVTITGNTTLTGLSDGSYSLVVYAKDTAGNTGASEIIYFTIQTAKTHPAEPFPIGLTIAAMVIVVIALAAVVVLRRIKT